jgi:DNA-binding transcriptional MerR regulator
MHEPRWTLDELAERVGTALAVDYHGQASGRVRPVPDRRAIRWYTTIGLIDRPVAHRGRTALYGPRHLLQLVAVKRLQARGLPLVSIQQELAGATDSQLARVARLPAGVAARDGDGRAAEDGANPGTAVAAPSGAAATQPTVTTARSRGVPAGAEARRAGFWREQPAAFNAAADADATAQADANAHVDPTASADPGPARPGPPRAATLQGLRLGDGATLLLEPGRELGAEDVHAILDAARPLLDALRDRGLSAVARDPDPELRPARGTEPRREHP